MVKQKTKHVVYQGLLSDAEKRNGAGNEKNGLFILVYFLCLIKSYAQCDRVL
jgi:hypothetical protein